MYMWFYTLVLSNKNHVEAIHMSTWVKIALFGRRMHGFYNGFKSGYPTDRLHHSPSFTTVFVSLAKFT